MSGFHNTNAYEDENNENVTPNIRPPSSNIETHKNKHTHTHTHKHNSPNIPAPLSNIQKMKVILDKYSNNQYDNSNDALKRSLKRSLKPIIKNASVEDLSKMYDFASSQDDDAYGDAAKILKNTIERREEYIAKKKHTTIPHYDEPDDRVNVGINRQLKTLIDNTNKKHKTHKNKTEKINANFVRELIKLTDNASNTDLISAYKFTLMPKTGDTKPGYSPTSNILDNILEENNISRNSHGRLIDRQREFATPFKRISHKNSSHHGGAYKNTKKRSRPSLQKSRRVKKRKTNVASTTIKSRK
jgi:hypothetical protein